MQVISKIIEYSFIETVSPLGPNEEIGQEDLGRKICCSAGNHFLPLGKDHPWVFNTQTLADVADFSEHLSLSVTFLFLFSFSRFAGDNRSPHINFVYKNISQYTHQGTG